MADYPSVRVKVSKFVTPTDLQRKLLEIIGNDRVKRGVNQIIGERANEYVPMESGALRESMKVGPNTITWGQGLDYARYQYGGEVYAPNYPITVGRKDNKMVVGWRTPPGTTKYPTGRELGVPGEWHGWKFGYTTPGTHHHWIAEMLNNEQRAMNVQITAYLKRAAKELNK